MPLKTEDNDIISNSGKIYNKQSFIEAINEFNKKCPIRGSILNRNHIYKNENSTHITHKITLINGYLVADIEVLSDEIVDNIDNVELKPIIVTPLTFGTETNRILKIVGIQLELKGAD